MKLFFPDTVYVNPKALNYECGLKAVEYLKNHNINIINSRSVSINEKSFIENYDKSKKTVFLTINSQKKLPSCKPSANYQFSLSSSCPGKCEYCYLQTTQGEKPYIKIFVNIEDILKVIQEHINKHLPDITTFECASITDPVALDHITGNLKRCIEFFSNSDHGRLRLVTKFDNVDSFLNIDHKRHTTFRFSLNSEYVINNFEKNTSSLKNRILAAKKVANSGYPIGFIIAPIMIYPNWKKEYKNLIENLSVAFKDYKDKISFELIQHRFTSTAKELILNRFPNTLLDLNEDKRQLKWGPYGKFKYIYTKDDSEEIKTYMSDLINKNFKNAVIEYFT
ncbi:spore photoproduct lyase [Alkalithermobacter thermoalcaliphilus JW-YL-7 = DSM 7308]|uniref:Spore photoproduct lyase n=1 Tax=Alkalithermobacter thermoalcaliphilus JW-YL-7 = DSM 7308 TaxID=1121328 RepID=A0A150FRK0_CLOPD|nr:Spore photoproduct lyase [[Clostridium] paradoxum JW-YL-7 = DSM 7308]SHK41647.1 spore photoproduct lyase [[Clostridium] paradoxum JW-YL-7 = DSM 7308]